MYDNPIGLAAARKQCTGAFGSWGEQIWDAITWIGASGDRFRAKTVYAELLRTSDLSRSTARSYVGAFIAYAMAVPEEFSGPASRITRVRKGWYRLADNPDPER